MYAISLHGSKSEYLAALDMMFCEGVRGGVRGRG